MIITRSTILNIFSFLANYRSMNNLLLSIKKSPKFLAYPFIFVSSFMLLVNFINIFPIKVLNDVYLFGQNNLEIFFGISAVFFVNYYINNSKKAFASAICYAFSDSVFYALSNEHFSLLFSVIIAFLFSAIIKNLDLVYSFVLLLIASFIFAIVVGVLYDYLFSGLKAFCSFMNNKESLFGVANNLYSVMVSDNFGEMFYTKDFSSAAVINDSLVVGIKNIFLADTKNPTSQVASFMTGKYLVNLFVTLGVFVALYSHFDGIKLTAFSLVTILTLAFGDIKLLSLFILVFNPMIYLAFLAMIFVSYLLPVLLDIRIGFNDNGSIIELFKYGNNLGYILLSGIVIGVMTYFLVQMVVSKFDIQKQKVLPREVRRIVNALGGEKNIQRVSNENLIVKNPNLINILSLDCDIMENVVTLHYGELDLLKQYF